MEILNFKERVNLIVTRLGYYILVLHQEHYQYLLF